jgi:hypothetical protein
MKTLRLPIALISGIALALAAASALANTTNQIAQTTFDAGGTASWGYHYWYGDNGMGVAMDPNRAWYDPNDWNYTNAMCYYWFDTTGLAGSGNNNYGTGFGAPLNWGNDSSVFISSNRQDYLFSFDARVEGLLPDQTTANCEMQVQFLNSAQSPQKILQVNLSFNAASNMTHFTFALSDGGLADSSDATFAAGYQGITSLQFNVNRHVPSDSFGFDWDNAIVVDNLQLEVIDKPIVIPPPLVPVAALEWNMDDKPLWYGYGGYNWSENSYLPTFTYSINAEGQGVDGSRAWILAMDNSALATQPPAWAGGGTGGGGPVDFTRFDTGDLASYAISFDARVEGISSQSTGCGFQLFLDVPDDTLQPPDSNTDNDLLLQMNFPVTPLTTQWQRFSFPLDRGSVGGGSKANFSAYYNLVNGLRTQFQIENASSFNDWGYDADNALVIDNIRLDRLYPGCPPLRITQAANNMIVTWDPPSSGTAKLQSATSINGAWSDVPGAVSGYSIPVSSGAKFFRTQWVPPAP